MLDIPVMVEIAIFGLSSTAAIALAWGKIKQEIKDNKEATVQQLADTKEITRQQVADIKTSIEKLTDELHNGYVCRHHSDITGALGRIEGAQSIQNQK